MKTNLILIGMPSAGKSTIGAILAEELGYDFLDVDALIAERQGASLQEIIRKQGIGAFLAIEGEVGAAVQVEKTVLAPGGSMVFSEAAMENLRQNGLCVYLKVPLATLEERLLLTRETRGLAASADTSVADIFETRRPLYEKYADHTVDCDGKGIEEVVKAVREAADL